MALLFCHDLASVLVSFFTLAKGMADRAGSHHSAGLPRAGCARKAGKQGRLDGKVIALVVRAGLVGECAVLVQRPTTSGRGNIAWGPK
jgi:hypothetical protein